MFEDIIGNSSRNNNSKLKNATEICPICKSTNVTPIWGIFVSSHEYVQIMKCIVCNSKWIILYDEDLNIKNVTIV